jgi:hypothetical protein
MATTNISATYLLGKLEQVKQRLDSLSRHVKTLERHTGELDELGKDVGKLKFEIEEMREEP